ncbi:hypothetical protein G7054_g2816 [Neopestalotiopsis clavispora]|nr:hypothetical protein G7054_g2816 [Neopestalotiopsis clavispora]
MKLGYAKPKQNAERHHSILNSSKSLSRNSEKHRHNVPIPQAKGHHHCLPQGELSSFDKGGHSAEASFCQCYRDCTEDQASDHTAQSDPKRPEFDLDVTEAAPTSDQLRSILEYVGASKISSVVPGASTEKDALKKFKEGAENFKRPVIVDWNNGRAVASENESEILKMVNQLNKD